MWQQPGGWGQQQWPIQQSHYANVAHDSVDWASLAKQWMQFKDAGSGPDMSTPPPPPSDGAPPILPPGGGDGHKPTPWNGPAGGGTWGNTSSDWTNEVDMEVEGEGSKAAQPAQAFDYNHGVGSGQQASNIASYESSYHSSPVTRGIKESMNNTTSQPPPHHNQFNQGYEYNQQNYHAQAQQQYWMQQGSFNGAPPFGGPPPHMNQHHHGGHQGGNHHRPHFQDEDVTGPNQIMDAAKRKALPAWIREGLEKMEKEKAKEKELEQQKKEREEKQKQAELEREKAEEEAVRTGIPLKSKFEDDEEGEEEDDVDEPSAQADTDNPTESAERSDRRSSRASQQQRVSRSPSPEDKYLTPEERQQLLMRRVKMMLTEVLLSVTNEEIEVVCKSVYSKYKKQEQAGRILNRLRYNHSANIAVTLTLYLSPDMYASIDRWHMTELQHLKADIEALHTFLAGQHLRFLFPCNTNSRIGLEIPSIQNVSILLASMQQVVSGADSQWISYEPNISKAGNITLNSICFKQERPAETITPLKI